MLDSRLQPVASSSQRAASLQSAAHCPSVLLVTVMLRNPAEVPWLGRKFITEKIHRMPSVSPVYDDSANLSDKFMFIPQQSV